MAEKQRIAWLDAARGISILLVVLYHAILYLDHYDLASYTYTQLNEVFRPIRMPMFFAISGVLATRAISRDWGTFVRSKILFFAYVYGLWSLIRLAYFGFVQTNINQPDEGSDALQLLAMWYYPNSGLWFIWALAIYFLAAKLLDRFNHVAVMAMVMLLSAATFGGFIDLGNFAYENVLYYAPFFLVGVWYGRFIVSTLTARPVAVGIAAAILFVALHLTLRGTDGVAFGIGRLMLSAAGLALGGAASIVICRVDLARQFLCYLGRTTLPIYVTHVIAVAALSAIVAATSADLPLVRYWAVPLVAALALAISISAKFAADSVGAYWLYAPPNFRSKQIAGAKADAVPSPGS